MKGALAAWTLGLTLVEALVCGGWAADPGLFVAVGYGGRRMVSHDGLVWEGEQRWSDAPVDNDDVLVAIAFGACRFVAVGGGAKVGHILSSRDGLRWEEVPGGTGRVATIAFGNGRFVAAQDAQLLTSTDGVTFRAGPRLEWKGNVHARRSACGDTEAGFRFVIVGDFDLADEGKRVAWRGVTGDGTRWDHTALDTPTVRDIAYGAGQFIVVGPDGLIESSHDGETWRRQSGAAGEEFSRVVWTGSRFLASAGSTTWSSPDGLTWMREPGAIPGDIVWAQDGFVALGFSWAGALWNSRDGTHWQQASLPPGPPWQAVAFGSGSK